MDFNKIKEMGLEYAEKGKNAALDLAEKGRTQAKIVNAQGKLYKAQRQLGALVYSLAKGNEENQPLVDKYIEMIANIEQELCRPESLSRAGYHHRDHLRGEGRGRRRRDGGCRRSACRGKARGRRGQDLPPVRRARLGRCAVLQQVRRTAVS